MENVMAKNFTFVLCISMLICLTLEASTGLRSYNSETSEYRNRRDVPTQPRPLETNDSTTQTSPITTAVPITQPLNCTKNGTDCRPVSTDDGTWSSKIPEWMDKNKGILERTMYVLVVLTVIVVLYFLIKMIRLRRRRSKTRRYGVLSTGPGDNLEMTPLDQDDDEDDMTVFEVNGHRK